MNQKIRLDLHTHSIISYDGGITASGYGEVLSDPNNFIAITDHNELLFASQLRQKHGDQVIVGEEIMSESGEIIGLFMKEKIQPGLSAQQTCDLIHEQGGLVYIPHPLETMRKGLQMEVLEQISSKIDIIEIFNARLRQPKLQAEVEKFAAAKNIVRAASSDAHGLSGLGTAFSVVQDKPTRENLVSLLRQAVLEKKRAPLLSYLHPAANKLKKKFNL